MVYWYLAINISDETTHKLTIFCFCPEQNASDRPFNISKKKMTKVIMVQKKFGTVITKKATN